MDSRTPRESGAPHEYEATPPADPPSQGWEKGGTRDEASHDSYVDALRRSRSADGHRPRGLEERRGHRAGSVTLERPDDATPGAAVRPPRAPAGDSHCRATAVARPLPQGSAGHVAQTPAMSV